MTTLLHAPVAIDPSGLVRACAWCCSPRQLADLERRFPETVTHGICASCSTGFDAPERPAV